MANQTIAQLPYDLSSSDSLKRFLRELVDNLDEVLGYKGTNKYVKDSDFQEQGQTLEETTEQSKDNATELESIQQTLKQQTDELFDMSADIDKLNSMLVAKALDTIYRDFNNSAWAELTGRGYFTALFSELTNAPISASPTDEIQVFVDSTAASTNVWQTVTLCHNDGTTNNIWVFTRIGVNSQWAQLSN